MFSWIRHYVAEVCALPSALLVLRCNQLMVVDCVPYKLTRVVVVVLVVVVV